jgi:hypothetical protein
MTEPKAETWAETVESATKTGLAVIGMLFGLGLILVNIYLGYLGFTDFTILRPRFVLVGMSFLIYLAIPPAAIIIPMLILKRTLVDRPSRWLLLIPFALFTALALESPTHYFVPYVFEGYPPGKQILTFWSIYTNIALVFEIVGVLVPAVILAWIWDFRSTSGDQPTSADHWVRMGKIVLMVGIISMIFPYAIVVYPNVSSAVGGGQPALVDLSLDDHGRRAVQSHRFVSPRATSDSIDGPFILWHEATDRLLLSAVDTKRGKPDILSLPSSHVVAIHYLDGYVRVRHNMKSGISHTLRTATIQVHLRQPTHVSPTPDSTSHPTTGAAPPRRP